jgi:putative transposase
MQPISYARHRFPPDVVRHAVWRYLRFTLNYGDVEDLLAERGLIVSNNADADRCQDGNGYRWPH